MNNPFRRRPRVKHPQKVHVDVPEHYTFRHYSDSATIVPPSYTVPAALAEKELTIRQDCCSFLAKAGFDQFSESFYDYELETLRSRVLSSLNFQRTQRLFALQNLRKAWIEDTIRIQHDKALAEAALSQAQKRLEALQAIRDKDTNFEEITEEGNHVQ